MKKDLISISIIFLGVSIIVSSIILSRPKIEQMQSINSVINGSLGMNQSIYEGSAVYTGDIISLYTASEILLYENPDQLKRDIESGNQDDIPYVFISNSYLFSKRALEEWIYSKSLLMDKKVTIE